MAVPQDLDFSESHRAAAGEFLRTLAGAAFVRWLRATRPPIAPADPVSGAVAYGYEDCCDNVETLAFPVAVAPRGEAAYPSTTEDL